MSPLFRRLSADDLHDSQTFMNAMQASSITFCVAWVKYAQSSKVTAMQVRLFQKVNPCFSLVNSAL